MRLSEKIRNHIETKLATHFKIGENYIDIVSRDIQKELGINNRAPSVCGAMRKIEKSQPHKILVSPPKDNSTQRVVRYYKDEAAKIAYEYNDCLISTVNKPSAPEGKKKEYYTTTYERNSKNRQDCIKVHGTICKVCDFNFYKTYGELGKDFIEVHHIKPLYNLEEEIVINPAEDLVPVCSNCHRMLHRNKDKILTTEELRKIIGEV